MIGYNTSSCCQALMWRGNLAPYKSNRPMKCNKRKLDSLLVCATIGGAMSVLVEVSGSSHVEPTATPKLSLALRPRPDFGKTRLGNAAGIDRAWGGPCGCQVGNDNMK